MKKIISYIVFGSLIGSLTVCIPPLDERAIVNPPKVETTSYSEAENVITGTLIDLGDGIIDYGFIWSTINNPPRLDEVGCSLGSFANNTQKTFSCTVTGVNHGQLVIAKAYAEDVYGRKYQGNAISFQVTLDLAVVRTDSIVEDTDNITAKAFGTISSIGEFPVVQHGHVWSSVNNPPTLSDNQTELGPVSGPTSFVSDIPDLQLDQNYHIRAYTLDSKGNPTYSNALTFSLNSTISINMNEVSGPTYLEEVNSYELNAQGVLETNLTTIFPDYGFQWSTSENFPANQIMESSEGTVSGNTELKGKITGIIPGQTYYIRAFVKQNGENTVFSNAIEYELKNAWLKVDIEGERPDSRTGALVISASGTAYFGLGGRDRDLAATDFWRFDPIENSWDRLADFPGEGTFGKIGFSTGNIFTFLGSRTVEPAPLNHKYFTDSWYYNVAADNWVSNCTAFPGPGRRQVILLQNGSGNIKEFIFGGSAYLDNTGKEEHFMEVWQFNDCHHDPWIRMDDIPGEKKYHLFGFSHRSHIYFGGSLDRFGNGPLQFYKFDPFAPSGSQWSELDSPDIPCCSRTIGNNSGAFGFSMQTFIPELGSRHKAYVYVNDLGDLDGLYEYNEFDDDWSLKMKPPVSNIINLFVIERFGQNSDRVFFVYYESGKANLIEYFPD